MDCPSSDGYPAWPTAGEQAGLPILGRVLQLSNIHLSLRLDYFAPAGAPAGTSGLATLTTDCYALASLRSAAATVSLSLSEQHAASSSRS